jgi:hypothetical protein
MKNAAMLGQLHKMHSQLQQPVQYSLTLSEQTIALNPLLGQRVCVQHTGRIVCVHCQKLTKKSFNQGYCYNCFSRLAQCDLCIMKPETCHHEQGTCREPAWAADFCFQPHIVYLANSSGIKVGITRQTQIPTRWIDQGASQALPVFQTQSRYLAGLLEVTFAQHISDKTQWQTMLKQRAEPVDLAAKRDELLAICAAELTALQQRFGESAFEVLNAAAINIDFPIAIYPKKITSFNLDKNPTVVGTLQGIKGQYWLLDSGVINIRKFSGYEVELSV